VRDKVTMALYLREVDFLSHGEYISADKAMDEILLVKASLACDSACATPTKNVEQGPRLLVVTLKDRHHVCSVNRTAFVPSPS
jgi:hypothetical protein